MTLSSNELTEKRVNRLAKTFEATWPNIFLSHFQEENNLRIWRKIWIKTIADLSEDMIKEAIKKSILLSEFPPSPAQFRKYALRILSPDQAYASIAKNQLAARAYAQIDSWLKKTGSEKEIKQEFIAIYKNLAEELLLNCSHE